MREMIAKGTESFEKDPDTLSIRCPNNHLLYREHGMPNDLVDDSHVPKCFKCKQPNLPAHQMYYRCIHEDCKVKDCAVEDCESMKEECKSKKCKNVEHTNQYYELCRICSLCEEIDPNSTENPMKPVLSKSIKCDFYPSKLYRHPIKNPN